MLIPHDRLMEGGASRGQSYLLIQLICFHGSLPEPYGAPYLDAMRRANIKGALVGVEAVTPRG